MTKTKESICTILDEALVTFDEFEEYVGNPFASESTKGLEESIIDDKENYCSNVTPPPTEKPNKKRSWKKPKDKPKRPLSAYNLYFQYEREHMISGGNGERPSTKELLAMLKAKDNRQQPKEKRRHRKTHGKVSFGNLARSIADKWKNLDKETRAVFENEANQEKIRYKNELEEWNKKQHRNENIKQKAVTTPSPPAPLRESNRPSVLNSSVNNTRMPGGSFKAPSLNTRNQQSLINSKRLLNNCHDYLQQNHPCQDDLKLFEQLCAKMPPYYGAMDHPQSYCNCNLNHCNILCNGGHCSRGQNSCYIPIIKGAKNHQQLSGIFPMTPMMNGNIPQPYSNMNELRIDPFDSVDFEPIEYKPVDL